MPKVPMDYSNTIIYKIVCRDLEIKNCYVGHTTNFTKRKGRHKSSCKTEKQYLHQFINEYGGWDNWDMIMVEQYPCNNLYEASARERYWIETLDADLNKNQPPTGLTKSQWGKQWAAKNPKKIKEYSEIYRIKNANKLSEYFKQRICCIKCKTELSFGSLGNHYKSKH
jgi:hypothetical protein